MNVKFPNNTSKWQIEFNSAFKGLITSPTGAEFNSRDCAFLLLLILKIALFLGRMLRKFTPVPDITEVTVWCSSE
jgi:hypothetical protein